MDNRITKKTMDDIHQLIDEVSLDDDTPIRHGATMTPIDVDDLIDTSVVSDKALKAHVTAYQKMRELYNSICNSLTKVMMGNGLIYKDHLQQLEQVHFVAMDQLKRILRER